MTELVDKVNTDNWSQCPQVDRPAPHGCGDAGAVGEHGDDTDRRGYEIRMRCTLFWTKGEKHPRAAICDVN